MIIVPLTKLVTTVNALIPVPLLMLVDPTLIVLRMLIVQSVPVKMLSLETLEWNVNPFEMSSNVTEIASVQTNSSVNSIDVSLDVEITLTVLQMKLASTVCVKILAVSSVSVEGMPSVMLWITLPVVTAPVTSEEIPTQSAQKLLPSVSKTLTVFLDTFVTTTNAVLDVVMTTTAQIMMPASTDCVKIPVLFPMHVEWMQNVLPSITDLSVNVTTTSWEIRLFDVILFPMITVKVTTVVL